MISMKISNASKADINVKDDDDDYTSKNNSVLATASYSSNSKETDISGSNHSVTCINVDQRNFWKLVK